MKSRRFSKNFLVTTGLVFMSILPSGLCLGAPQVPPSPVPSGANLPGISGDQGMTQKGSSVYRRLSRRALRSLEENKDPFLVLGHGESHSQMTRLEFETYCIDNDSSDVVSWQTTSSRVRGGQIKTTRITFSCVLGSELPKVQERIFVFSYEMNAPTPRLVDIQIAAADLSSDVGSTDIGHAKFERFEKTLGDSQGSVLSTPVGKVAVAISGAVLSSGASAKADLASEAESERDALSRPMSRPSRLDSMGKGALLAGLSAALSHFIFDMAPATSGLAGGALSIVVEDIQEKSRKGLGPALSSPASSGRLNRAQLSPVTVYLTFKF